MINTIETQSEQLRNGYFQRGNGPTEILILGSCRTVPYIRYLQQCGGDQLTIRRIDPCDWTLSGIDLTQFETDERILKVLRSTKIFAHEYLINYGMFNTELASQKNIYQFGIAPEQDITIPNFNDHLILEKDYEAYGATTPDDYIERGEFEIRKFCDVCEQSSFPEFGELFEKTWRDVRYFYRPNHVSALFTKTIFTLMNEKFLKLPMADLDPEDLFKDPHTDVTQRDRDGYGLKW